MKITGNRNSVKFDFENGYVIKANGELLVGKKFLVYKDTMKAWEPPHEKEPVTQVQIDNLIKEVENITNDDTAQIIFE